MWAPGCCDGQRLTKLTTHRPARQTLGDDKYLPLLTWAGCEAAVWRRKWSTQPITALLSHPLTTRLVLKEAGHSTGNFTSKLGLVESPTLFCKLKTLGHSLLQSQTWGQHRVGVETTLRVKQRGKRKESGRKTTLGESLLKQSPSLFCHTPSWLLFLLSPSTPCAYRTSPFMVSLYLASCRVPPSHRRFAHHPM